MRKFFLITAILLSATTAHAGLDATVADADTRAPEAIQSSSAQRPDASEMAAKREAMMQQKMAMQREMQRHPIRTRLHFAILKFKQKMHYAFR